ncbi:hypothetical protein BLEM_0921 [Bifidobacterium lemurum]|uniref:Uncharacterized protein n=1 Tax=Bifidobacterium lemurum TaxID=1603886 RepID=A0A261FTT8_9BIFI|nr:hypothetical protein [Bifidobacterium lemurum]OZG62375.1 hypothetical protein BLEM_0921 [Bifidobacterium lemurum]QOL33731.1 hypothetical protein BL8807_08040 [Bifidobacterium lemurum]
MTQPETQGERASVVSRFPELERIDQIQPDQQIETFSHVLDELQRELDDERR